MLGTSYSDVNHLSHTDTPFGYIYQLMILNCHLLLLTHSLTIGSNKGLFGASTFVDCALISVSFSLIHDVNQHTSVEIPPHQGHETVQLG